MHEDGQFTSKIQRVEDLDVVGIEGSEKVTLDVIGVRKPIVIGP